MVISDRRSRRVTDEPMLTDKPFEDFLSVAFRAVDVLKAALNWSDDLLSRN